MRVMRNLYFNFFFLFSFLFLNANSGFSESESPSLDFNEKQKVIVDNVLSSCEGLNFNDLLNAKKKDLGISEPDKSVNKKNS